MINNGAKFDAQNGNLYRVAIELMDRALASGIVAAFTAVASVARGLWLEQQHTV